MDDGNGQFHLFPSLPEWGRSARVGKMASTGRCGGMFQPTNKRCDSERFLSIHKRRTLTSNGVARTNGFVSIFPSTLDYYRNMLMNPGSPQYPRLPDQVFLCACIWCTLLHFFSVPFSYSGLRFHKSRSCRRSGDLRRSSGRTVIMEGYLTHF